MTELTPKADVESRQPELRKSSSRHSNDSAPATLAEDRAKENGTEKMPASLPIRGRKPQSDLAEAPPIRQFPTAAGTASRTEQIAAGVRPVARDGNGEEKKQEGPRLSIGRLEVQIIQESAPPVSAGQFGGREALSDDWEEMDRRHIRHLSAS